MIKRKRYRLCVVDSSFPVDDADNSGFIDRCEGKYVFPDDPDCNRSFPGEELLYTIYQLILVLLFYPALPFLLAYVLITGNHREGVRQRLSLFRALPGKTHGPRIWLHAASVGEVQAASLLIEELRRTIPESSYFLTTMTIHGRKFAEELLPDVRCQLAPLDVPGITDLAIRKINPDMYICIETELWPVLLKKFKNRSLPVLLLNGRMSERSAGAYRKHAWIFKPVLENFDRLCLISETDRQRYLAVGVDEAGVEVAGNLKYDRKLPEESGEVCRKLQEIMSLTPESEVLVAGSTHPNEEEQLLPVYRSLDQRRALVWIVAPRHLQRLRQVTDLFTANGLGFDLFSDLKAGADRQHRVIVVDSFGDLTNMYSVATYIFCGGSLVERRGHNIMEAALWGRPVFYGPSMDDFRDAAELLEQSGGGFCLKSADSLFGHIKMFREDPAAYRAACRCAGATAKSQQGAAGRQAAVVLSMLSLQ